MRHLAASAMAGLLPHNELRPPPAKAMPGVLPHRICRNNMHDCNGRSSCTWLQAACTARRLAANCMHATLTTSCTSCTASSPPHTPPPHTYLRLSCKPHARLAASRMHGPARSIGATGCKHARRLAASRMHGPARSIGATGCKHARRDQLARWGDSLELRDIYRSQDPLPMFVHRVHAHPALHVVKWHRQV